MASALVVIGACSRSPATSGGPVDAGSAGLASASSRADEIPPAEVRLAITPLDDGLVRTRRAAGDLEGVIVPQREGARFYVGHASAADDYFTASAADVERLERVLARFMTAEHPELTGRAPTYKRQYIGVVEHGRRLIFANLFCTSESDWVHTPVIVDGGGDCFVAVKFDAENAAIVRFTVNASR